VQRCTLSDPAGDTAKLGHVAQTSTASYEFAAHTTHVAFDVRTGPLAFTPANPGAHRVQLCPPASGLKVPEAHDTQFPAGPVKPGAHWHAPRPTPPSGERAFGEQVTHTLPPMPTERMLGEQSRHADRFTLVFAEVWPAAHGVQA